MSSYREAEKNRERLLVEALDSGEDMEVGRAFWQELNEETRRRIQERSGT